MQWYAFFCVHVAMFRMLHARTNTEHAYYVMFRMLHARTNTEQAYYVMFRMLHARTNANSWCSSMPVLLLFSFCALHARTHAYLRCIGMSLVSSCLILHAAYAYFMHVHTILTFAHAPLWIIRMHHHESCAYIITKEPTLKEPTLKEPTLKEPTLKEPTLKELTPRYATHCNFSFQAEKCVHIASHRHGCCVFQRCVDFASPKQRHQVSID